MARGMVTIEADRCKGCGICVDFCKPGILRLADGAFNKKGHRPVEVTDMSLCTGCTVCAIVCPDVVFTVYRERRRARASS